MPPLASPRRSTDRRPIPLAALGPSPRAIGNPAPKSPLRGTPMTALGTPMTARGSPSSPSFRTPLRVALDTESQAGSFRIKPPKVNPEEIRDLSLKQRMHALIDATGKEEEAYADQHSRKVLAFSLFSFMVIVVSVIEYSLETLPEYYERDMIEFKILEIACVSWFTLEFLFRVATCPDVCQFFSSLFNWIDLVAILPFYIGLILRALTGGESAAKRLIVLRVIRLTRVFRIFKLSKYNEGVQVVWVSLSQSSDALSLLVFLVVLITVLFGSAMFYAEQLAAQWDEDNRTWVRLDYYGGPAVDHPFQSIFNGYWWCIVTVTTVGYGDLVPVTFPGYLVGVMTMFCGVLTLAFPVIIIGAKFTDVRRDYTAEKERVEAEALAEAAIEAADLSDSDRSGTREMAPVLLTKPQQEIRLKELVQRIEEVTRHLEGSILKV